MHNLVEQARGKQKQSNEEKQNVIVKKKKKEVTALRSMRYVKCFGTYRLPANKFTFQSMNPYSPDPQGMQTLLKPLSC